jgi:NADPH:quinone reductase-like Zn-dependent oxidoreductase
MSRATKGFRPIAIVRRDDQIALLKQAGAAHVLNARKTALPDTRAMCCKDEKPRILLDAVTGPQAATIFNAMPRRSRWIVYGRLDQSPTVIREPGQLIFMHKKIEGFWLSEWMRTAEPKQKIGAIIDAQKRFIDGRWSTDVTASCRWERR